MYRLSTDTQELLDFLSYRRPAGSKTEKTWISQFIRPLGVQQDSQGNLFKKVGGEDRILWSSHTDTVHKEGGRQTAILEAGRLKLAGMGNCLGADCAAGAWLMVQMARAHVPGLYVWHRGEEHGGIGSAYIAQQSPEALEGIKFAIAFDRRGTDSIITHQMPGRTCSDEFAWSLADAIGLGHKPDDTGLFTDTANYAALVGECTNISTGTANEHCPTESLDLNYLLSLRDAICGADFSRLVEARTPEEPDYSSYYHSFNASRPDSVYDLVRDNPREIADYLSDYGISSADLRLAIQERQFGTIRQFNLEEEWS